MPRRGSTVGLIALGWQLLVCTVERCLGVDTGDREHGMALVKKVLE